MSTSTAVPVSVARKVPREQREGVFAIAHCDDGIVHLVIIPFATMVNAYKYGSASARRAVCEAFDKVANELFEQRRLLSIFSELVFDPAGLRAAEPHEYADENVWYPALPM